MSWDEAAASVDLMFGGGNGGGSGGGSDGNNKKKTLAERMTAAGYEAYDETKDPNKDNKPANMGEGGYFKVGST
jgi:hypothetical protein